MEQRTAKQIQEALAKPFAAGDLEWRLQKAYPQEMRGIAVPYVTNRAIQYRLDDVVGVENWYNRFKPWHMKSQEAVLEQITQNSGNVIVGRFEDYGSGIDYRRPGLCAALEMVKSGQADALLMKNENRLGRNVSENLRLVAALRKTGRRIFFADNLIW